MQDVVSCMSLADAGLAGMLLLHKRCCVSTFGEDQDESEHVKVILADNHLCIVHSVDLVVNFLLLCQSGLDICDLLLSGSDPVNGLRLDALEVRNLLNQAGDIGCDLIKSTTILLFELLALNDFVIQLLP
jgi:hypothetical protein